MFDLLRAPTIDPITLGLAQTARANYISCHGVGPNPMMPISILIDEYLRIPTLEELSARLSALDEKLTKYREKRSH